MGDLGVAVAQPVFRKLHLLKVADLLVENAELIADPVPDRGISGGRQGVQKQAASRPRPPCRAHVGLFAGDLLEIDVQLFHGPAGFIINAQIDQVVDQHPPHQVLG
jgi:hypothetical protein